MRPKHFSPSVKDSAPSSPWFIIKVKVRQENPHVSESFMTNSDTNILFLLMKVYLGSCHASSPTSIFKGHKIPFNAAAALCQVTWIFQLKSISVLAALCVSVLTDTPPEAWGHSVRRCSSVLSLWCLMNVEGNSRCCFSSPDDEVHWTFWGFFSPAKCSRPFMLLLSWKGVCPLSSQSLWMTRIKVEWFCSVYATWSDSKEIK